MKTLRILSSAALVGASLLQARAAHAQSDLGTIKARMLADAVDNAGFKAWTGEYYGTDLTKIDSFVSSMASNGSWSDIAYSVTTNDFPSLKHLDRMLVMSYTYSKSSAPLYKSATLLAAINKALGYWYTVNPKCANWYMNDIAKQFYLGPIGMMMQGVIDSTYFTKIVNDLTDAPSMTGANKSALSTSVIYRAILEGNASRLSTGVAGVSSVIGITAGDGLQRDYSFQQHGGILYNGNYGFEFFRDTSWVGAMLAETQYALPASQVNLLRDGYLEGTRWMIRNAVLDYNTRGRQVGAATGTELFANLFLPILDHLAIVDPANKPAYQTSKEAILNSQPQNVSGVRHYFRSDYTSVQRGAFFTSLKMCSKRTLGIERNVNTENLMGYWLPYGQTYTYRRGDEFDYIFPVWDWARIPGVTAPHQEISFADDNTATTTQNTTFVGGASDGAYGATAMDFSLQQTTAKKSWFWFDQEWVALGAGIQSTHVKPVFTSIQQVLLKGSVLADGAAFSGSAKALTNPRWVLHDAVGYVFPTNQTVQIQATAQTGTVKRIFGLGSTDAVSSGVFSLWIDHGASPQGATYQYVVIPGIDAGQLDSYAKNLPLSVLSDTTSVQAVTHKNQRVTGAVFYQAGQVGVPAGPSVSVDAPCIVLLNEPAGTVTVSDPNQSRSTVTVTIANIGGASKSQSVALPGGDNAGKSVVIANLLDKRAALPGGVVTVGPSSGAGGVDAGAAATTAGGTGGNGGSGGSDSLGMPAEAGGMGTGGSVDPGAAGSANTGAGGASTLDASTPSPNTGSGGGSTASGAMPTGGANAGVGGASAGEADAKGCACSALARPTSSPKRGVALALAAIVWALRAKKAKSG